MESQNEEDEIDTSNLEDSVESKSEINLFSSLPKAFPEEFPMDIIPFLTSTEIIAEFNSDNEVMVDSGVDRYTAILQVRDDVSEVMSLYSNYIHTLKDYSDDPYYGTDSNRTFYGIKEAKEGYYVITIIVSKDQDKSVSLILTIDYYSNL